MSPETRKQFVRIALDVFARKVQIARLSEEQAVGYSQLREIVTQNPDDFARQVAIDLGHGRVLVFEPAVPETKTNERFRFMGVL